MTASRVPDEGLEYLQCLPREVGTQGTLLENSYLCSCGLNRASLEARLRTLSVYGSASRSGWWTSAGATRAFWTGRKLRECGPPCGRAASWWRDVPLVESSPLRGPFRARRQDLIEEEGPRITTMRNYRFAIVKYGPDKEFDLPGEVRRLSADLTASGCRVLSISLQKLLLERIRAQGEEWVRACSPRSRAWPPGIPSAGSRN